MIVYFNHDHYYYLSVCRLSVCMSVRVHIHTQALILCVFTGPYCHGGVSVKDFKHDDFTKKPPQLKETHWYINKQDINVANINSVSGEVCMYVVVLL